jgi:hypothetical protein
LQIWLDFSFESLLRRTWRLVRKVEPTVTHTIHICIKTIGHGLINK